MFSLNDYASFNHLFEEGGWFDAVKDYLSPETAILLVGNKADLEQQVYDNIIEKSCEKYPVTKFLKLSAINGTNIDLLSDYVYLTLFSDSIPISKEFIVERGTSIYLN